MILAERLRMGTVAGGGASLEGNFIETKEDGDNRTIYTFPVSGYDAGVLAITIHAKKQGSSANTISSVTVGGNAATEAVQISSFGNNTFVTGVYYISLASSFTGDIVVTFGGTQLRTAIGTFSLPAGVSPDFTDSTQGTGSSSLTVGDASQGLYIVGVSSNDSNSTSVTNSTEVYRFQMESNAFAEVWGGFDSSSGSKTFDVSLSNPDQFHCSVAARFA